MFFLLPLAYGQTKTPSLEQQPIISVVGRLVLEKHGKDEQLLLHSKDAQAYLIIGNLKEKLKNLLLELGKDNLVSLTGKQSGKSNISCERTHKYEYNERGERELKTETKCIRYYLLQPTQLLEAKKSDEEIPPPKRDTEEEKNMLWLEGIDKPVSAHTIIGEIYGVVSSVNLRTPIKTVEIANRDKNNPLKRITLVISPVTRIVKKIEEEPMALSANALKAGQEVTAVYSRDEFKSEALFITITKE